MTTDVSNTIAPAANIMSAIQGKKADMKKYKVMPVVGHTGWLKRRGSQGIDEVYPDTKRWRQFGNQLEPYQPTPQELAALRGDVSRTPLSIAMPNGTYADQYEVVPEQVTRPIMPMPPQIEVPT